MPASRTPAQAEASRRNGGKGKGPRTAEGKAKSAMNAMKHGLTATTDALVAKEDPDAFAAHCAQVEAEYAPLGPTERALVAQLAMVFWRMVRAEAVEAEVLVSCEPRPDGNFVSGYGPLSPFMWDAARLNAVVRYRGQLERSQFRLLKELKERREAGARAAEGAAPDEPGAPSMRDEPAPAAATAWQEEPEAEADAPVSVVRNEPEPAPSGPAATGWRNEPGARPSGAVPAPAPLVRNEPEPPRNRRAGRRSTRGRCADPRPVSPARSARRARAFRRGR
ncbi:MAG: hypothetical protein KDG89_02550 [Geminicoccaceae bacterium]|nr:hypothetical protein [Geminicoccaceae bacterium]